MLVAGMNFTVLTDTIAFFAIAFNLKERNENKVPVVEDPPLWIVVSVFLSPIILILTIIVNLNNWLFYYIKILQTSEANKSKLGITKDVYLKRTKIMNLITVLIMLAILSIYGKGFYDLNE